MIKGYDTISEQDPSGNLICKGCSLRFCVTVTKDKNVFCHNYGGSAYDGKSSKFFVKCNKEEK